MRFFWTASKVAFYGLLAMFALWFATAVLLDNPQVRPEAGCYWFEAKVFYIECRGFAGAGALQSVLNLPLWLVGYGPAFLYLFFTEGHLFSVDSEGQLIKTTIESPAEFAELVLLFVYPMWLVLGLLYPFRWAYLKLRARSSTPEEG